MLQRDGKMEQLGGPGQCTQAVLRTVMARFHNWVQLVNDVIAAELPEFEIFSSLHTLLQLEDDPTDLQTACRRIASVLKLRAVS